MPFVQIPKILKLDHRIWWAIFGVSQALIFSLMLGSIFTTSWIELKPNVMKGSMLFLREILGFTGNELYSHFYDSKAGCKNLHKFSLCKLINDLDTAGTLFAIFEWIGFVFLIIWFAYFLGIIFKCGSCCRCCYLHRPYFEAIMAVICHYIASIAWLANSHAEFTTDCDWNRSKKSIPTVCATDGPNIALFLMIFLPIVVAVFIFVFQISYKNLMAARGRDQEQLIQAQYIPPGPAPQFYQGYQLSPIVGQEYSAPRQEHNFPAYQPQEPDQI